MGTLDAWSGHIFIFFNYPKLSVDQGAALGGSEA